MSESAPPRQAPLKPTTAEREVADLLPIDADPDVARAVLDRVPLWFHTFSLANSGELYTPGVARDHRYRIPALPEDFSGMSVLDVGTFDGFYAFLAEARGARRVTAVDNEQYRVWVKSRWGVELDGGEGFMAIRELLDSKVEYCRLDAFDLDQLDEAFDLIVCFGILHRVDNPLGLLNVLRRRLSAGGRVLLETYGAAERTLGSSAAVQAYQAGEVYARRRPRVLGLQRGQPPASGPHRGLSGVRALRRPGHRWSSARHRHAAGPGALATSGPPRLCSRRGSAIRSSRDCR